MKRLPPFFIILVLWLTACGNEPLPSPTSSAPVIALPGLGNLVYSDDFSNPESGWANSSTRDATTEYLNGTYHLMIPFPRTDIWVMPAMQELPDSVSVAVKVTKTAGPGGSTFGIVCHYMNAENFYYLYINGDGHSGIDIMKEGFRSAIDTTNVMPSVNLGDAVNQLRADCMYDTASKQTTLIISANGTALLSATDDTLKSGSAGIMATSLGAEGINLLFDDFQVYELP